MTFLPLYSWLLLGSLLTALKLDQQLQNQLRIIVKIRTKIYCTHNHE